MKMPPRRFNSLSRRIAAWLCALITIAPIYLESQAQTFLTNGLVAYYPFNGNPLDATGHGYNGEVHGAKLVSDRFGHANSAYSFTGSNSFVLLTNSFTLPTNWTVSAWAHPATLKQAGYIFHIGTDPTPAFLETMGYATNGNGFGVACNNGVLLYGIYGDFWWGATPPQDPSTWFHVLMRFNGVLTRAALSTCGAQKAISYQ
jgi:hypothetical protein